MIHSFSTITAQRQNEYNDYLKSCSATGMSLPSYIWVSPNAAIPLQDILHYTIMIIQSVCASLIRYARKVKGHTVNQNAGRKTHI